MGSKKRVAIIGHFGGNRNFLDGQTVKTRILFDELKKSAQEWNIVRVDTYFKKSRPVKLILESLWCMFTCHDIIVLLSGGGMRVYFPLLNFCSKAFKTRVYHDVIGGNLDNYVRKYPKYRTYLSNFKINWVETEGLKTRLADEGVINCAVIPNYKRLPIVTSINQQFTEPYRFCTFSRVMKEKGIEDAISAIENINSAAGREVCKLDIYGQVDNGYQARFEEVLNKVSSAISYCGKVPYDASVDTLKDYYALLFPTYWDGEGFPGTIVDAFAAGVPVIASDWNCNAELVEDEATGIVYPGKVATSLDTAVLWAIGNKEKFVGMRQNCADKAHEFMPEKYIEIIVSVIEGN